MTDFTHYLNVRNAFGGSLRADGQRLAFLHDATGTTQVWTMSTPGAWPRQRTFYANRVTFVQYAPTGNQLIFGMDEGGNEQTQFFLMDDDGLGITALTDAPSVKHNFGGWSPDGRQIAFTATQENDTDFFVYVMTLETREIRRISDLGGYNLISGWIPDGSGLIVSHNVSNVANDLYHVQLGTNQTRLITPHDGEALFQSVNVAPDGQTVWLSSNLGRDFLNVAQIDLETLRLEFVSDKPWDEEFLTLSEDGDWLAVASNEDGYGVLDVMNTRTLARRTVHGLPPGVLGFWGGMGLGADGQTVLLDATSPTQAVNVWAIDLHAATATRWTDVDMGSVPREALIEPELVRFESFDGLQVPALYLRPHTSSPERSSDKLPVVIIIHGGPESQSRPLFHAVGQYLASMGFAVLFPNVRGSSGYGKRYLGLDDVRKRMDSVADIKAAVAWLTTHGNADPTRIAVYGGSYGGFMVLSCLTTYPELFAAGVDIVGIASFVTFLENTSAYRRALREAEYGSLKDDREFLHAISPLTHLDRIQVPLFVVHGANDPRVPVTEAEQVVAALQAKGIHAPYLRFEDEGHGLAKLNNKLEAYPKIAAFLSKHLKP